MFVIPAWTSKCKVCGKEILRAGPIASDTCSKFCQSISEIKNVNEALEQEKEDKEWYLRNDTWIKDIELEPWVLELHGRKNRDGEQEYAIVEWCFGSDKLKLHFKGEIIEENL